MIRSTHIQLILLAVTLTVFSAWCPEGYCEPVQNHATSEHQNEHPCTESCAPCFCCLVFVEHEAVYAPAAVIPSRVAAVTNVENVIDLRFQPQVLPPRRIA